MFDYYYFHTVLLRNVPVLSYFLLILWLLILFYLSSTTAEDYFTFALDRLARILRLSPNVAGIVLLAFGNGAPDFFTALAGASADSIDLVVGSSIGAGAFVTMVVYGSVLICAKKSKSIAKTDIFLRDLTVYLVAAIILSVVVITRRIYIFEPIILFVYYALFIAAVVLNNYFQWWSRLRMKLKAEKTLPNENPTMSEVSDDEKSKSSTSIDINYQSNLPSISIDYTSSTVLKTNFISTALKLALVHLVLAWRNRKWSRPLFILSSPLLALRKITIMPVQKNSSVDVASCISTMFSQSESSLSVPADGMEHSYPHSATTEKHEEPRKPAKEDLRNSGISWNAWFRLLTIINPMASLVFFAFVFNFALVSLGSNFPLWALLLMIGLFFSVCIFFTTSSNEPPKYYYLLLSWSFIMSIVWIYAAAVELVGLLTTFGKLWKISQTVMGLTVLAWGNSFGDLITDVAVARIGPFDAAAAAVFAAPLFNLGISLSLNFMIVWSKSEKNAFYSLKFAYANLIGSITTLSFLVVSALVFYFYGRKRHQFWYGIALIFCYLTMVVFCILLETGVL